MQTARLRLVAHTGDSLRALMSGKAAYEHQSGNRLADGLAELFASDDVSPDYIARLQTATTADPWTLGYALLLSNQDLVIGTCGYKGPPTMGVVESAYGIAAAYWRRGSATEAAQAFTAY